MVCCGPSADEEHTLGQDQSKTDYVREKEVRTRKLVKHLGMHHLDKGRVTCERLLASRLKRRRRRKRVGFI